MKQRDIDAARRELTDAILAQSLATRSDADMALATRFASAIESLIKLYAGHDEPKRREPDGGDGE